MAQAYLTLIAGGERRPLRLVISDWDTASSNNANPEDLEQVFERQSANTVLAMLRDVVEEDGTGQRARISIPGIAVGGKTGTAQKAVGGTYGYGRMASFVGIAPMHSPRYLVVVLIDEPTKAVYGGVVAAPVFRKVITHTLAYRGELPEEKLDLAENELDRLDAAKEVFLSASGQVSDEANAAESDDAQGVDSEEFAENKYVTAALAGLVPNVVGKSVRRAMEEFITQGVTPVVKGEGKTVLRQEPGPGAPLVVSAAVEYVLWLSE
jgi:cell division protein FtsI (penicillin-binding protein 3)